VFTASSQDYADQVIDIIDPTGSLIQFRLYRQHCYATEDGHFIKDLRVIRNRNLADMLLVDNSVHSFGFQLDNGVPIIPYYDDPND
jgi:CTD small phosphatase-like protein 2